MLNKFIYLAIVIICLTSCKPTEIINLPEQTIEISDPNKRPVYNPSRTQIFDLLHTKLDVKFNWEKAYLYGKAELTLKPYFYNQNELVLNARGMNINKVQLISIGSDSLPEMTDLNYSYDSLLITINLEKEYTKNDTLKIYIDYTSKPNELIEGGSSAIRSDKGLYFINEKGEDKDKPQQIWTQGETESNSTWFPTIDSPNEKSTEEIAITVEEKYKTLSNGILTHSELNGDGTRTDFWEMNLPHAPYLFMMAIGDYAVVKDKWRDLDVDYYVEHEFEQHANAIFGLTPEMIEFFSTKLGVDYPWQKYNQVVVRDYVSGAMENTTAVIFGEFVQQTKREMIDGNYAEDVISHELFHHWFGDLVTCESWANLPLNESFATYGEVLWREYKYGDDKAAEGLQEDINRYLREAKNGKYKDLIRFDYKSRESMFDRHSYQKGGRILHMLRNHIGDEAFFTSLKDYLNVNQFTAVEMHQFRLACEKVTGEDLNWFFNQWFFASGHPILDIHYFYEDSLNTQTITVEQLQDLKKVPIYKLPLKIDIYIDGKVESKEVIVDKVRNIFSFNVSSKPDLVNFDADKMLLCEKVDNHKSLLEWSFMYHNAPRYLDRFEAISALSNSVDDVAIETIIHALSDKNPKLRRTAIKGIKIAAKNKENNVKIKLLDLAKNDRNSKVRGDAMTALVEYFDNDETIKAVLINGLSEESYYVIEKALENLSKVSSEDALKFAKSLENEENSNIKNTVCNIYAEYGEEEQNAFFIKTASKLTGYSKYAFILSYNKYLKKQNNNTISEALPILKETATKENAWWLRMNGINTIIDLENILKNRIHITELEIKELPSGSDKELDLRNSIDSDSTMKKKIEDLLNEIKETEKNPRLRKILGLKN
jgi:aminopeptidase N